MMFPGGAWPRSWSWAIARSKLPTSMQRLIGPLVVAENSAMLLLFGLKIASRRPLSWNSA